MENNYKSHVQNSKQDTSNQKQEIARMEHEIDNLEQYNFLKNLLVYENNETHNGSVLKNSDTSIEEDFPDPSCSSW